MPTNSELSKNDRNRQPTEHATAQDLPGSGGARRAGDKIETRKSRNRSALDAARNAMNPKRKKK